MITKSGRIAKFIEYLWHLLFEQIYKRKALQKKKLNQKATYRLEEEKKP